MLSARLTNPMSLSHIHYRVVGEDDYVLEIEVTPTGAYRIDSGDHTSHEPRQGQLNAAQEGELSRLLANLGEPKSHHPPLGASGFMTELTVGDATTARHYQIWSGALSEHPEIAALVRALDVI